MTLQRTVALVALILASCDPPMYTTVLIVFAERYMVPQRGCHNKLHPLQIRFPSWVCCERQLRHRLPSHWQSDR